MLWHGPLCHPSLYLWRLLGPLGFKKYMMWTVSRTLLASSEMQQFDKARVFLDEDFTAVDKFTVSINQSQCLPGSVCVCVCVCVCVWQTSSFLSVSQGLLALVNEKHQIDPQWQMVTTQRPTGTVALLIQNSRISKVEINIQNHWRAWRLHAVEWPEGMQKPKAVANRSKAH